MNEKINKTAICSVVALDIIDYSKKTNAEQVEIKNLLNDYIHHAVIDIPQDDRVITDTGSGVAIACSGPLEDALEDALFISITIRDEILKNNAQGSTSLYVQFGIHLGAARVLKNSMAGEGIDEAKRIMSFANPNQILVSNVYFEMASKLTQEIAQMFEKYEMHAHDHEVYAVRLLKEAATGEPLIPVENTAPTTWQSMTAKVNWLPAAFSLLVIAAFIMLAKWAETPIEPAITVEQPVVTNPSAATELTIEPNQASQAKQAEINQANEKQVGAIRSKTSQKKTNQKDLINAAEDANETEKSAEDAAIKPPAAETQNDVSEKSGWQTLKDSVKQGKERNCTQAEIAMNQCAK